MDDYIVAKVTTTNHKVHISRTWNAVRADGKEYIGGGIVCGADSPRNRDNDFIVNGPVTCVKCNRSTLPGIAHLQSK